MEPLSVDWLVSEAVMSEEIALLSTDVDDPKSQDSLDKLTNKLNALILKVKNNILSMSDYLSILRSRITQDKLLSVHCVRGNRFKPAKKVMLRIQLMTEELKFLSKGMSSAVDDAPPSSGGFIDSMPAFFDAAMIGDLQVVSDSLAANMDPNSRDGCGMTPMHFAAIYGHVNVISALLAAGGRVDAVDEVNIMLSCAYQLNRIVATTTKVSYFSPLNCCVQNCRMPMDFARLNNHVDIVEMLKSAGGNDCCFSDLSDKLNEVRK